MELDWTWAQEGEEQWLHGGDGVAAWRKKENGTTKDHLEKDSGKGVQTGGVFQLGRSQQHGTRQGKLENTSCSLMHLMARREPSAK